jgi:nitric oxide reductase NorD protein
MEEWVGGLWDSFITRHARRDYPAAAVHLGEIDKLAGVLFRALGGDPGLRVAPALEAKHGAKRRWLSRLAGTDEKSAHAALDIETLRLPPSLAGFPTRELNRDHYLWLIALAAHDVEPGAAWIVRNQCATLTTLARYPGLASRQRRLLEAHLAERIAPEALPDDEAAQERAIRAALQNPGTVAELPPLTRSKAKPPQPVPLWLYPLPPPETGAAQHKTPAGEPDANSEAKEEQVAKKRHSAKREDMPDNVSPMLMMFRAESLLSFAEYVKVNRALDDDPNPDAGRAAESMDQLALAEDNQRVASKVRFDLDLPAAAEDDVLLGDGIPLPEWDYRKRQLMPDWVRLQMMAARNATPAALPERLRRPARKLRSQFAALQPVRHWQKAQPEGSELDIDACVRLAADRLAGQHFAGAGAYLDYKPVERDLACLLLADLSLSTDSYVNDDQRVIDVIRDSLMLFGEALSSTGDAFAIHGFSSLKRSLVRFHRIKDFDGKLDAAARGRIAAIKPGYYTRIGAAVRHATKMLERQPVSQRVLLLLSDGKPHDIDLYEGRYGIEDTRVSLIEAREKGIKPFCVTIDREGASYLPHLFGAGGFTVVRKPEELPSRLPLLYAQLTGH